MSNVYRDRVLIDNPILYYRLDQLGFGTDGESVPDIGSAGLPATLQFNGGVQAAWGHPSPIQTDTSSREFWGYTNAGIFGFGDGTSTLTRASHAAMTITNDFTVEEWVRPMDNIPAALDFAMASKQGTGGVLQTFIGGTHLGGYCFDNAGTLFKAVDTSFRTTDFIGTSFYCVTIRAGNTVAFYVNGRLKAQTTVTSGLPTQFTSSPFNIHVYTGFYTNARHDEVAFYNYALTGTTIKEHYEAALLTIPLRATIGVRVTVELDTDQVPPTEFPFAHNFSHAFSGSEQPITEVISFKTNINQSEPDYQQRVNAQPHHVKKELEYAVTPASPLGLSILKSSLWQPAQVYKLGIDADLTFATDPSLAGTDVIFCDTTLRDFEVGSYLYYRSDVYDPDTWVSRKILEVADDQLVVSQDLDIAISVDDEIVPARLACLEEGTIEFESYLQDHESGVLPFTILDKELSTRRVTPYTPAETYDGIEVFNLELIKVEWLQPEGNGGRYLMGRRVDAPDTSIPTDFQRALDTGSPYSIPIRLTMETRAAKSIFYGWAAARQGKQNPVWIISEDTDFHVLSRPSNHTLIVSKFGYLRRYNMHRARRDVAFQKPDETHEYFRITNAVDNGNGTETLTFVDLLDPFVSIPTLVNIRKLSFLKKCTAPDAFEIVCHRNERDFICETAFSFTELLA